MAEEINFEIKLQTAAAANTAAELKKAIKSLKDELNNVEAGSEKFRKLSKAINDTEGKLGDLNDSFQTLTGSGVERANKSFKLFTEGLTNFDLGKIKASLGGLGAAFKAIPIFLIVEGVMYLIQNFKELSSGTGILAKALKPVGDLIGWIKDGLYLLTDAIGLTNSELDKMGETVIENAKATNEALSQQTKEFDRQMQVAKAAGKSTIDIEKQKQQAIIDTNVQIVKQIEAYVRAGGELSEEQNKQLTASLEVIKDARTQQRVIELNHQKEERDNYQKHLEEKKKIEDNYNTEFAKKLDLTVQSQIENEERDKKAIEEKKQAEIDAILAINAADNEEDLKTREEKYARDEKEQALKDKRALDDRNRINETLNVAKMSSESQAQLANFLFDLKRKNAVKGSAEDLKLAKRQFQLNKALAIQTSIISGIQGVINALSAQSVIPEPYGTILKVANAVGVGIAATINTAKIASQQFNEGGGGSMSADVGGLGGGGATASAPAIAQPNNSVTKISDEGKVINDKPMNNKVYVLETDITDSNKKISSIEETARIK